LISDTIVRAEHSIDGATWTELGAFTTALPLEAMRLGLQMSVSDVPVPTTTAGFLIVSTEQLVP
jgi:hypothetical protein